MADKVWLVGAEWSLWQPGFHGERIIGVAKSKSRASAIGNEWKRHPFGNSPGDYQTNTVVIKEVSKEVALEQIENQEAEDTLAMDLEAPPIAGYNEISVRYRQKANALE